MRACMRILSLMILTAGCSGTSDTEVLRGVAAETTDSESALEDEERVVVADIAATITRPKRLIFIAIDGLNPRYIEMDRLANGPGSKGNWLMPWVRAMARASAQWVHARAHVPQATDMNHLNIVAGTHSGTNGILGVSVQPERWTNAGLENGEIHLAKTVAPDGVHVETLFDRIGDLNGDGNVQRAYLGNKNWVPAEYDGRYPDRPPAVDIIVNGNSHPSYVPAPYYLSFYDNPYTDGDWRCDPETPIIQTLVLNKYKSKPQEHPRDFWIADAALRVIDNEDPDMMYILLADMDHGEHFLGSVGDPDEWIRSPIAPKDGCPPVPAHYNLVSRRNPQLRKEAALDLIHDVDRAFGKLLVGLADRGMLADSAIVLVSDHNMINYLHFKDMDPVVDVMQKLKDANLASDTDTALFGGGSIGYLYWRNADAATVAAAKEALLDPKHKATNPETGNIELPWGVMDRADMIAGRVALGDGRYDLESIAPGELYHSYSVENGLWPDLIVVMQNGWPLGAETTNIGPALSFTVFNAGHGTPDTAEVMAAMWGLGFPMQTVCREPATLSDVAATVAKRFNISLPQSQIVGQPLTCTE